MSEQNRYRGHYKISMRAVLNKEQYRSQFLPTINYWFGLVRIGSILQSKEPIFRSIPSNEQVLDMCTSKDCTSQQLTTSVISTLTLTIIPFVEKRIWAAVQLRSSPRFSSIWQDIRGHIQQDSGRWKTHRSRGGPSIVHGCPHVYIPDTFCKRNRS